MKYLLCFLIGSGIGYYFAPRCKWLVSQHCDSEGSWDFESDRIDGAMCYCFKTIEGE